MTTEPNVRAEAAGWQRIAEQNAVRAAIKRRMRDAADEAAAIHAEAQEEPGYDYADEAIW